MIYIWYISPVEFWEGVMFKQPGWIQGSCKRQKTVDQSFYAFGKYWLTTDISWESVVDDDRSPVVSEYNKYTQNGFVKIHIKL